jgi:hypothetical protein
MRTNPCWLAAAACWALFLGIGPLGGRAQPQKPGQEALQGAWKPATTAFDGEQAADEPPARPLTRLGSRHSVWPRSRRAASALSHCSARTSR